VAIVRALLFADLEGYSKMKDGMVKPFLRHVIGRAASLGRSPAMRFVGAESLGDGFFLTFATASAAARFALRFADVIKTTNWQQRGLPDRLKMRIALHAGPVHRVVDPLTKRVTHTGTHVIKPARIEPKAPANEIWTSQEFAALAALEDARDFSCSYVGEVMLPKDYGRFPLYRLTAVRTCARSDGR
jgi:class 3 adenylate cyclase